MAALGSWAFLPSVALTGIFSKLSHLDRIRASSTCKRWRSFLFLPEFWPLLRLDTGQDSPVPERDRAYFLVEKCARSVKEVILEFDPTCDIQVSDASDLLEVISRNCQLQSLTIRPNNTYFNVRRIIFKEFCDTLLEAVKRSRRLEHLALGCLEDTLLDKKLINVLVKNNAPTLRSLYVGTVRNDSNPAYLLHNQFQQIANFTQLFCLGVDYDYLTFDLLQILTTNAGSHGLGRLSINVHRVGINPPPTNQMWEDLISANPSLEVFLNVLHSSESLDALASILKPSIPLAKYRQYLCGGINVPALNLISKFYEASLRNISITEACVDNEPICYDNDNQNVEDPFVMLAWRCTKLSVLHLFGISVHHKDLIAIARLRPNLAELWIPASCIYFSYDDEDYRLNHMQAVYVLVEQVSESLGRFWHMLTHWNTPPCVFDEKAEPGSAYVMELLSDQLWTSYPGDLCPLYKSVGLECVDVGNQKRSIAKLDKKERFMKRYLNI